MWNDIGNRKFVCDQHCTICMRASVCVMCVCAMCVVILFIFVHWIRMKPARGDKSNIYNDTISTTKLQHHSRLFHWRRQRSHTKSSKWPIKVVKDTHTRWTSRNYFFHSWTFCMRLMEYHSQCGQHIHTYSQFTQTYTRTHKEENGRLS